MRESRDTRLIDFVAAILQNFSCSARKLKHSLSLSLSLSGARRRVQLASENSYNSAKRKNESKTFNESVDFLLAF
jgi:hypothetical protein